MPPTPTPIAILDYGMGNLRSVQKAIAAVGGEAVITADPQVVATHDKLILPGVGAFADGMEQLRATGLDVAVKNAVDQGKAVLGICLGMQLLFESSVEPPASAQAPAQGLGVLPGKVLGFDPQQPDGSRLKVPHMGWNTLEPTETGAPLLGELMAGLGGAEAGEPHVYFVHGYYCLPADESLIAATTPYGQRFCSAARRDRVWALQFHPEKSQAVGLEILRRFVEKA